MSTCPQPNCWVKNVVVLRKRRGATLRVEAAILAAIANPHRLKILMLMRAGHRTLGDIAPALTLPRNGVFQHMALLQASGLVVKRRYGGRVFCHIRSADVSAFLSRVLAAASGLPAPDRDVRP